METDSRDTHVLQTLRAAVHTMMAIDGTPKCRLRMALVTSLLSLKESEFPEGTFRRAFAYVMDRIRAASRSPLSAETIDEAFGCLSDTDVLWVIDRLHTLAFAMAIHLGANQAGAKRAAS